MTYSAFPQPMDPQEVAAILAEAAADDARAIADVEGASPLAVTPCAHHAFSARVTRGSTFDDHTTQWGQCLTCKDWLVLTDYVDGRSETRRMTDAELARFEARENRIRRGEWLADFAEGHHG